MRIEIMFNDDYPGCVSGGNGNLCDKCARKIANTIQDDPKWEDEIKNTNPGDAKTPLKKQSKN